MLIKTQNRSVRRSFRSFLIAPRQSGDEVRLFLWARPARQNGQIGGFDCGAIIRSKSRDSTRRCEEIALNFFAHYIAIHEHESLGDRTTARIKFIFAGVAVAADEIVPAGVRDHTDKPVRLGAEGRERRTLKESAGHLFWPQTGHREDSPCFLLSFRRRIGDGAIETEHLRRGDDSNQTVEVIAVCGEIVGKQSQSGMKFTSSAEVVDGLCKWPPQDERPDAVDRRSGKVGVARVDNPGGEPFAGASRVR